MGRSRDLSLTTKGALVVALPVIALLLAMLVFYQLLQQRQTAEADVERSFEMRSQIRQLLTQMVNAETGIRGYLLTRRESFLEPYQQALAGLPSIRANLKRLSVADPAQS